MAEETLEHAQPLTVFAEDEAIFRDSEVPSKWASYTELNKERATALQAAGEQPMSTDKQEAKLPDKEGECFIVIANDECHQTKRLLHL